VLRIFLVCCEIVVEIIHQFNVKTCLVVRAVIKGKLCRYFLLFDLYVVNVEIILF